MSEEFIPYRPSQPAEEMLAGAEHLSAIALHNKRFIGGEPYFNHCERVAKVIQPHYLRPDKAIQIASLLAEAVNSGPLELEDLKECGMPDRAITLISELQWPEVETEEATFIRIVKLQDRINTLEILGQTASEYSEYVKELQKLAARISQEPERFLAGIRSRLLACGASRISTITSSSRFLLGGLLGLFGRLLWLRRFGYRYKVSGFSLFQLFL